MWTEAFDAELTSPQYSVLTVLAASPGIDQRQLGGFVSLDKSSAADVVARLVERRWVERARASTDARRDVLTLTADALGALERITPRARVVQERLLELVPPPERPALLDGLRLIARVDDSLIASVEPHSAIVLGIDAPGSLLRRSQQVHTAIWAETFVGELTGPQFAAMQVLAGSPGISQRDLGERGALDKSTAADIVARLVRRGWIERARDPLDGRSRILTLSGEARASVDTVMVDVMRVQERLLEPVSREERQPFLAALALVAYAERA